MKQGDTCGVSNIWSSTVGDDTSDEMIVHIRFLSYTSFTVSIFLTQCSSTPEPNAVNNDSLHSKGSTDVLPAS